MLKQEIGISATNEAKEGFESRSKQRVLVGRKSAANDSKIRKKFIHIKNRNIFLLAHCLKIC